MGKKVRVEENIIPAPPVVVVPETPAKKKMFGREAMIYGILSGVIIILCIGFFYQRNATLKQEKLNQKLYGEMSQLIQKIATVRQDSETENNTEQPVYVEPEYVVAESLKVEWEPELIEIDKVDCQPDCSGRRFIVGTIKGGEYDGNRLYLEGKYEIGEWFSYSIVDNAGKIKFISDDTIIQGVTDISEFVRLPGTSYELRKTGKLGLFSEIKTVKKVFTHPELGDFYLTDSGCLVVELPDHTAQSYGIVVPFEDEERRLLNITFTDGKKNDDIYSFRELTCGPNCGNFNFVDEDTFDPSQLVVVGKTSNNENVYGIKNENDPVLKEIYEDENTVAYTYEEGDVRKNKYTYAQFISYHPLLYWKDPLGRWVEMKNDRFAIAAEMCKPAIYLYPTEKTILSVKVHPDGGFTYTDPEYGTGWTVEAGPEGIITDMATGKTYDYLFWEGKTNNYPVKNEGWVIAQENLKSFFSEKLAELGMNQREITDFTKYWVRSLSDKPYYQISFLTKDEFDTLAPLEISPVKPDSVIRIMMTATGLNSSKEIKSPVLPPTPERVGFTVVEWGGVVLK
jgi:hypothetical protein